MIEKNPTAVGTVAITDDRHVEIGALNWQLTEFDGDAGRNRYMLTARGIGSQFSAHFDAEQWLAFQRLVMGELA